jgi:hypothetical protein
MSIKSLWRNIFPKKEVEVVNNSYQHNQEEPLDTWYIKHNRNKRQLVTVFSSEGEIVWATIDQPNFNEIIIRFNNPYSGTAVLISIT